jgi:hypothetical protein
MWGSLISGFDEVASLRHALQRRVKVASGATGVLEVPAALMALTPSFITTYPKACEIRRMAPGKPPTGPDPSFEANHRALVRATETYSN